ncbi:arsenic transporter [Clostridium autoethanogenum]|nr:arsenic transporter [Clostridium autoethanogenum]ALU38319.1 Arsenical pump membrane protein [Clostridium autoethanogenum DSM 10061]OVY51082.1 Arsenical pump membrane protein [Clostridium autoethanogenum]
MSNTLIIVFILLFTIWCYRYEEKSGNFKYNIFNIYKGPKSSLRELWKMPHHIGQFSQDNENRGVLPPPPPPKPVKPWKDFNVIALFSILIAGSLIISTFNIAIATIFVFIMTIIIIFLRPADINEAYPASVGAIIILLIGVVNYGNLQDITSKVGGASITIISTIVMAIILESFGFFHWVAAALARLAKGSGYRLYWYIQLLCFVMTLFFNNDGSILITTPILILLLRNLGFVYPHEFIPYLLSGALIATGSSTPIGVSNITNLISLNMINMTLYNYTKMMFIPGTLGLLFMSGLMFLILKSKLPRTLPKPIIELDEMFFTEKFHSFRGNFSLDTREKRKSFMLKILTFVFIIRCLLFVASYFGIPIEIVAASGSIILLIWRWYYLRTNPKDILRKTPWHVLLFAFSMYVIIYGLNNIGLTAYLVKFCEPIVSKSLFHASFLMGGLISILSNIFNNHPALLIGTMTLTNMGLNPITLKTIYLANIIGSDIGSLLLPIGTLASLMWMFILKKNDIRVPWREYINVTIVVVPATVLFTLYLLFYWIQKMFF